MSRKLQSGYLLLGQSRSQNDLFIAHPHFPHLPGYLLVPLGTALGQTLGQTLGTALGQTLYTTLGQALYTTLGQALYTTLGQALYTTLGTPLGQALCMTLSTPLFQAFFDSSKHGIQRVTIFTQSLVVSVPLLF